MKSVPSVPQHVTQKTIAKSLGIDQSTVSACLNNAPRSKRYTPELRERILREAERLNYKPHFFASQLRASHPRMLLLCLGTFMDAHATAIGEAFAKRAEDRGYRVIISTIDNTPDPAARVREIIGPHGIQAVCLISIAANIFPKEELSHLLDEGVKIVLAARSHPDPRIMQATVNNAVSARMAYEFLFNRGLREMWVLSDDTPVTVGEVGLRAPAFIKAAEEFGGPMPLNIPVKKAQDTDDIVPGYEEVKKMLASRPAPQALFAVRDMLAYGAIRAFQEAGLKVGKDVSVIGIDDIWPSKMIFPALTSVHQPMRRMGAAAADLLIDSLQNDALEKRSVEFCGRIVERDSVVPLPQKNPAAASDGISRRGKAPRTARSKK